ncbi:hypothetical protein SO802_025005 [Lithocarpus litseifolius]|uniref:phosphoserine transaminase n=1 Tax=Lithocarpus litseifolius TaxID=425828 RepID=A0AAW2BVH8_9ROSI
MLCHLAAVEKLVAFMKDFQESYAKAGCTEFKHFCSRTVDSGEVEALLLSIGMLLQFSPEEVKFSGKDGSLGPNLSVHYVSLGENSHKTSEVHLDQMCKYLFIDLLDVIFTSVNKFGFIYAGAQKNVGPSGVTIVIIKKDLIGNDGIYMCGLAFEDLLDQGGLVEVEKKNKKKVDAYDGSNGFYRCPVEKSVRSLMNVPFTLEKSGLEIEFIKEAAKENMVELRQHKSVGGMRASINNAKPLTGVEKISCFHEGFPGKFWSSRVCANFSKRRWLISPVQRRRFLDGRD